MHLLLLKHTQKIGPKMKENKTQYNLPIFYYLKQKHYNKNLIKW